MKLSVLLKTLGANVEECYPVTFYYVRKKDGTGAFYPIDNQEKVASKPERGKFKVTNLYVENVQGNDGSTTKKLVVEFEDTPC